MVDNDPPTEEEVDRMVELYEDDRTVREVAEHDDIDYSRTTVNKWINRRQLEEEGSDMDDSTEDTEQTFEADPEPEQQTVAEQQPVEEQFADILEDEPPSPNDILWDVLTTDPDIKDKHVEYLRRFEDQYGVFSPDDVSGKLNELKITNKRMTINRAVSNYRTEINRKLQKDQELAQREEWALLLTKTTGNPRYLREADGGGSMGQFEQTGPAIEGPGGNPQQARGDQIQPPAPRGQSRRNGVNAPSAGEPYASPPQQGSERGPAHGPDPTAGQPPRTEPQYPEREGGLDPFQERLLEMLEQQMGDDSSETETKTTEDNSLTSQIQEIAEIQDTLDSMGGGDGENEELAQAIQQINEQVDQKLARLEAKVSEIEGGGGGRDAPAPQPSGEGGTMSEIAALAQQIDDPNILSTVIESQMDPEVIKARAETEEVQNEAQFKSAIAEALSPKAAEKAVEAVSNLTQGISTAAEQAQTQPAQPQQPRQPAQQPQPAQQQGQGVEVVDDQETQPTEPTMTNPDEATEESSPLREKGEEELQSDTDEEVDNEEDE